MRSRRCREPSDNGKKRPSMERAGFMSKTRRIGLTAAMVAVALTAGVIGGSPAQADRQYKLKVTHHGWFELTSLCLRTQSYDEANRDTREHCLRNLKEGDYHLSVSYRDGYRVWLDIEVFLGKNAYQITMHNGFQYRINEHVFNTTECKIPWSGTTQFWWLDCKREGRDWQQYWHS